MTESVATGRRRLGAEQRREQIADAAIAVVAEVGFAAATADAVARRAGTSKGLLWHHFEDRDDMLEHAARRTLAALRSQVAADVDLSQPVPDIVRAAVRRAVGLRSTHRAQLNGLREIASQLRRPDGSLRLGPEDYEETYAGQEALFRRGQVDGDLDPDLAPRMMAVAYQGAVDALLAYLDAHPDLDAQQCADETSAVLLRGMLAR
ncbi:MAG: TetR family transcriptional regulator [Aeromicrobium erythreum]